ncbi:MAG: UDP-N-acetylmuramoyl-L-alanyl-D-glutamate--2,6-diaminopimelate ligase [Termitinemataceae bacterium]|nr:MAG: UDP-N-acetylmuramoyl-L-alanyl-D-glutamate--2,6-diaminopimelate ligase [Termitinemataceae bacterium]
MKKLLNDLKINFLNRTGNSNPEITSLTFDSREVINGSLYFALPGIHTDGHNYIDSAISNGAAVIVYQNDISSYKENIVYIKVKDSRFSMAEISAAFYDWPSKKMIVSGVTGTEGKSTTVYLLFQMLRFLGKKCGFISTVQYSVDGTEQWNKEHQTTPEAPIIQGRMYEMLQNGVEYAVIESSSHGLSKKTNRLGGLSFNCGIMTNVEHEHLEFHGTWEQYRDDKANLFRALEDAAFGIVNDDDKSAPYFCNCTKHKVYKVSSKGKTEADFQIQNICSTADGNTYDLYISETKKILHITDKLPGAFNALNVVYAMIAASKMASIPIEDTVPFAAKLLSVRGRMTAINCGQNFEVLVDYAHTPSSFETIFAPIKKRLPDGAKIIALFGSPGERDTKKRRLQGGIAAKYSDIIILSDEDPRGEDPQSILSEIAEGVKDKGSFENGKNLFLIPNRREAMKKAFSLANKNDIVLLLGKGHENSIIYKNGAIKYDEIECAEDLLRTCF